MDPLFILGPCHGKPVPEPAVTLLPTWIHIVCPAPYEIVTDHYVTDVMYMKMWWYTKPGHGFWYYPMAGVSIDDSTEVLYKLILQGRVNDHQPRRPL
jgi:hypothetical protein